MGWQRQACLTMIDEAAAVASPVFQCAIRRDQGRGVYLMSKDVEHCAYQLGRILCYL